MIVKLKNGREVTIGDTVTLIGKRWYTDDHIFQVGDKMTIVEDNPNSEMYMNINGELITVEITGVTCHPRDFA